MTDIMTIAESLLTKRFVQESELKKFEGFEDFKKRNSPFRRYSPMAGDYVYCRLGDIEEAIEDISSDLIAEIYEGYKNSHLPMRTIRHCIKFIKKQGFSEVFAVNLICSLKLDGQLYSFPSVFGESEEDWVTPYENAAAFMKELSCIDLSTYGDFLEELEVDSCNLGNELICSNNPDIEQLLNSWANMGVIEFSGSGSTRTLVIKGRT